MAGTRRTRNETPVKVTGKGGKVRWKARYTAADGTRPSAGTFERKGPCRTPSDDDRCCAQHAIDAAYDKEDDAARRTAALTFGEYAATWTQRHPRGERTNATANHRLRAVLDVKIEGRKLRDWPYRELRRRHVIDLKTHLLTEQKRAAEGARGILRVLSAMTGNALDEDVVEGGNVFMGVTIRDDDVRVTKEPRPVHIYTLAQMHEFAAGVPRYEGVIRVLSDCGLRLGEALGLSRSDFTGDTLTLRGTARPNGKFVEGNTSTKHHVRDVPVAPSTAALITPRIDTLVLFPSPTGLIWHQTNFYRKVWKAAREATPAMAEATPQDFRHSWVSELRALGIDRADLAVAGGHSENTQTAVYSHAMNRSADAIRKAIG